MQNELNQPLENKPRNETRQETIKELADRHLADEHHTTSDEELRNARIVLDEHVEVDEENLYEVDHTTVIPPLPGEESDSTSEAEDDDKTDKSSHRAVPNPYDVLGS